MYPHAFQMVYNSFGVYAAITILMLFTFVILWSPVTILIWHRYGQVKLSVDSQDGTHGVWGGNQVGFPTSHPKSARTAFALETDVVSPSVPPPHTGTGSIPTVAVAVRTNLSASRCCVHIAANASLARTYPRRLPQVFVLLRSSRRQAARESEGTPCGRKPRPRSWEIKKANQNPQR